MFLMILGGVNVSVSVCVYCKDWIEHTARDKDQAKAEDGCLHSRILFLV